MKNFREFESPITLDAAASKGYSYGVGFPKTSRIIALAKTRSMAAKLARHYHEVHYPKTLIVIYRFV